MFDFGYTLRDEVCSMQVAGPALFSTFVNLGEFGI
jgi:hypothetical protein